VSDVCSKLNEYIVGIVERMDDNQKKNCSDLKELTEIKNLDFKTIPLDRSTFNEKTYGKASDLFSIQEERQDLLMINSDGE
jgi:hypothetical protein